MRGLLLRISIIVAAGFAVVIVASILVFQVERGLDGRRGSVRLPLPDQVVAIVELLETTPPAELALVLRALNTGTQRVEVVGVAPSSEGTRNMPGLALVMKSYLRVLGGRSVQAMIDVGDGGSEPDLRIERSLLRVSHPIRLLIGLHDGRTAVIEARGALERRLTGLRLSLIVLGITIVSGLAMLWALRRQLRPLERLATAVDQFGTRLETTALLEEGTPEVRQLIKAFGLLQQRIGALIAGRTRMIAAIGHDFGTYLTRLRLRIEFIPDTEQRTRAARDIEDMHALISDALLLARLDNDTEPAVVTDLAGLVRHYADGFTTTGAPVSVDAPPIELPVRVHPTAIGRAFNNLVANALRYGGRADVSVRRDGASAELLVEDRGPGIPEAERERVLEPFYRRDAARNLDSGGSGLGLSIVADVVRRSEGTLTLEDRPGGGLTARIRLPLAAA